MNFQLLPFPQIDPVLVNIGPLPIRWYALAYIAGLLLAWLGARALVRRDALWGGRARPDAASLDDLLLYCTFGVIAGGRLGNALFYDFGNFLVRPLDIFKLWNGGMAFHGGLIGALIAIWLFARAKHAPVLAVSDTVAVVAPIGLLLGRIANFIKPELWGRPTDVPWAVVFPEADAGIFPRHPSQLYEAALEGALLGLIMLVAARAGALRRPGLTTGLFAVGYALARTFCEFYREPDPVTEALGEWLTKGMLFSAPMLLIGLALVLQATRRPHAAA
jgi:phosphatidylglycerol---prolipoprotein diacylglyceryl transferase